jgi:hypothetical protein
LPRTFTIVTALLLASWAVSACETAPDGSADVGFQGDTLFPTADIGGDGAPVIWDGGPEAPGPDLWEDEDADDPSEDVATGDLEVEKDTGTVPPIGPQTPGPCQNPAYVPSPEFCNGVDDDCDGVIDDHAPCTDGNPCTMDVCLETSQGCASVHEPMGTPCGAVGYCFEGDCYNDFGCGDGWCEAGEDCENCDVDCGACDACGDTVCSAAETCTTCEADCGDCGLSCTGSTCDDGNACTQDDACLAGICQSGAAMACALWPDCKTGTCDPEAGCVYENKPDGTSCGLSMTCSMGTCLEDGLESGDIVITEFMANPNQVTDKKGEWFEVYNTTAVPIDINGWELLDDKTVHVITSTAPVLVPANGYAVLAKDGDASVNGGVSSLYAYEKSPDPPNSTFLINNDADGITLKAGWTVIDKVDWNVGSGWPIEPGVALQLDIDKFTTTANDSLFSWCLATSPYGSGDLGTPGSPNSDCP